MKEIQNTSDTALQNQSKNTLNQIKILSKGLKGCFPISGNLLSRLIEIIEIKSNTVPR